jgi:plastocyanin
MAVFGGCKKTVAERGKAPAQTLPAGTATVRGLVRLTGKPPEMAVIPNKPCHEGAGPLTEETVVADGKGDLQNVIVYLEGAPAVLPGGPMPPVTLDQVNCRYVPHVVALRGGQTLHVTTSDPTLHNVHGTCVDNPSFNFALVARGQSKDLTFDTPERFPVRCDVHPWMKAWVQVFQNPWFAVTDKDGRYELRDVPAGTYTLVAWQEKYGPVKQKITVQDGKVLEQDLEFKSGL